MASDLFSDKLFEAFILRRGWFTQNYDMFNAPNNETAAKLAQINEVYKPYSPSREAMFELRGSNGVLCKARMPPLGSGTNFDIRRIDAHPYLATIMKGPVKEDPKLCQDFVWRLTTQIDFFSPRRTRPWQEQIGRMDVELDGSTHREYRLKDKEDKKGQVYKEWETYDSHKVERWRAALQPMQSAAVRCARGGRWLPISMTNPQKLTSGETSWHGDAFSATVIHQWWGRQWSKLQVPPGQHIPMGLLAGQLCSRILAPWNVHCSLKLPSDAPIVSRKDWDDSWKKLGAAWDLKMRFAPGAAADVHKAFQPVSPKPGVHEWDRYPDYSNSVEPWSRPWNAIMCGIFLGPAFGVLAAAAAALGGSAM